MSNIGLSLLPNYSIYNCTSWKAAELPLKVALFVWSVRLSSFASLKVSWRTVSFGVKAACVLRTKQGSFAITTNNTLISFFQLSTRSITSLKQCQIDVTKSIIFWNKAPLISEAASELGVVSMISFCSSIFLWSTVIAQSKAFVEGLL